MKTIGLDLGDKWTGIALSDGLGLFARPHATVAAHDLEKELEIIFSKEKIFSVVVGLPTTMRGTQSDQTRKVLTEKEKLEKKYPQFLWHTWDERLTSKQADKLKSPKTKEDKLRAHSVAAAFILQSYLDYKSLQQKAL
jgi:putative Holliday junction resolvase